MGFPIAYLFSIRSVLLAGAQTCELFEYDLMATCKRSKETISDLERGFDLLSSLISNAILLKGRLFKKIRFSTKNCTNIVNRTFSFKPVFTFSVFRSNFLIEKSNFSRNYSNYCQISGFSMGT